MIEECNLLKGWTIPYREVKQRFENVSEMLPELDESADAEFFNQLLQELQDVDQTLADLEVRKMLSGELDGKNCYLSINSGAGGTEACDWALMLSRMYQRFAARRKWKVDVLDFVDGDVAGLKSITLKISGPFAYGYCKAERGVHRLVRISPFDSNARRHTSFASVDITPEIDDDIQVEVKPDQIRIDTYRASGAGASTLIKPTPRCGLRICLLGLSWHARAKEVRFRIGKHALKCFAPSFMKKSLRKERANSRKWRVRKKEISWGSQIRNYVFQPYTLVKDTRTKYEVGNIHAVMDGEIDGFINAYLKEFG